MTFTFLSVFLILCCLLFVGMGVLKGMKKGLALSALNVAAVLLGALAAGTFATSVSDPIAREVYELVELSPAYLAQFPSVRQVILVAADALIIPFVFVPLFFLCYWLASLLIWLFCLRFRASGDEAYAYRQTWKTALPLHNPDYAAADAPSHIRHDRLWGGIIRGFCGFLVFILTFSPVLGVASAGRMVLDMEREGKFDMELPEEVESVAGNYCYDASMMIFAAAGGSFVYTALGITDILGEPMDPREDLEETACLVGELSEMIGCFSRGESLSPAQLETVDGIRGRMEGNRIARLLGADIVNEICRSWLQGGSFYGIQRPAFGTYGDSVVDELLQAIRGTTEYTVAQDVDTLLQLFKVLTAYQKPNFTNVDFMLSSGVIDQLFEILNANDRTAHVADRLVEISFMLVAQAVSRYSSFDYLYGKWAENILLSVNRLNGMTHADFATRVNTLAEDLTLYCEELDLHLSPVVAQMAATVLYGQLQDMEDMTAQDIINYLAGYGG